MKKMIILLLITIFISSCVSINGYSWEDMSTQDKVVFVGGVIVYSAFIVSGTYQIENSEPVPKDYK